MRILMVQVPTSHLGAGERVYPLGLSRLSRLIPDRFEKWGLDMNLHPDPWPCLKDTLTEARPHIVALSFRNIDPLAGHQTSYVSSLRTAAKMVRSLVPNAVILSGGPAFSLFARRLMQEIPEIDCGLVGEGESVFPLLLSRPFHPGSIPGLIWRKGLRIQFNSAGRRTPMDSLPEMDLAVFPPEDYTRANKYIAAMGIEGKRGCDLHCAYCVYPCLGGKMRLRDPVKIVDEIERLHKNHGVDLFHFTDSVLNLPNNHFEAICEEMLKRNLRVNWTGFFREDVITEQTLDLASRAGLVALYFSGDALTDHGLKLLRKKLSKETILKASRVAAKSNILTMYHFLINLPGETEAHEPEALDLLDRILEIHDPVGNLGAVIFNNVRLYPAAPLTRKLLKTGDLSPEVDLLYPVYHNPARSAHVLHKLETHCHEAGVFSRLGLSSSRRSENHDHYRSGTPKDTIGKAL